mgnify:CR=1 FL=1
MEPDVVLVVPGLFSIEEVPGSNVMTACASWPHPRPEDDLDDPLPWWNARGIGVLEPRGSFEPELF